MRSLFLVSFLFVWSADTVEGSGKKSLGSSQYNLKKFEGKKNLLILFAPDPKDERFKATQDGLLGRYEEFRKKSLAVFYVFETEMGRADDLKLRPEDGADLRNRLNVSAGEFRVFLIDKKGKVKSQSKDSMTKSQLDQFLAL